MVHQEMWKFIIMKNQETGESALCYGWNDIRESLDYE